MTVPGKVFVIRMNHVLIRLGHTITEEEDIHGYNLYVDTIPLLQFPDNFEILEILVLFLKRILDDELN